MPAYSILLVEDEAVVALDLSVQLEAQGYRIAGLAANGKTALELAASSLPDLILMDVRLQGPLDGIQAAALIRRDRDVPIIFLTSHSDDETVRRAAETAPYGYLTKPYQIKELRAGIEVAMTKSRMEKQLRQADRWFAHTLRCVGDGVVVMDLDTRIRFLNPAAEKLTGWSIEDAVGRDIGEVVRYAPLEAGAAAPHRNASEVSRLVLSRGHPEPVSYALSLASRAGRHTVIDETAGPIDDDDGARLGAVLVLRDATERVAQEAELRASDERFRSAFDHAPLGMALVSFAGELIQVNDALCRLLDSSAEALKQLRSPDLIPDEDREHEQRRLNDLRSGAESVVQFERRFLRPSDGAPTWTLVSVSLLRERQHASCYLYQVHDLTEQRKAAERLAELAEERMRRQASELANAAKSEFLSRVSHEMRTPLNAVIGFAQLLELANGQHTPETDAYAGHIRLAGEHLLALVTDLLDLNRAAQGTLKLVCGPLGLLAAVRESVDLIRGQADAHGVALELSIAPDLRVVVDPMRFRQVLLNLVSNAIKYNREGGTVRLAAREADRNRLQLVIEDSGIGMTREQLARLFQPFERLGLERTRIPGVGLGMVIARNLVHEMGGSLSVDSDPRRGTTVTVDLERCEP